MTNLKNGPCAARTYDGNVKHGLIVFEERQGRVTLTLRRGEPHGIITTEHDWWESIYINVASPSEGLTVDLDAEDVYIAFHSYKLRQFPTVGEAGIRGNLRFDSVNSRQIIVSYDIVIDGVYPRFKPEFQHKEIRFVGRSTFHKRSRPEGELGGEIWSYARER